MNRYFTIGMAGHIDHGKTSLTKALTGVSTDSLKEEQMRQISIEPGFAPFINKDGLEVSIIDVPGHENFIRQMIAGVAGIDLVTLVIAADEGIMPQTKEHLDILSLLGIKNGVVVITKIDQADDELLEITLDDVKETLSYTFLKEAPMYLVDSISGKGILELKNALKEFLLSFPKKASNMPFRLPIDHVFTIKGQGAIVRGTIYNGKVEEGQTLKLLPANRDVRVRQIQKHQEQAETAFEGQRAAINLGGISHKDIKRGDVLVEDDFYTVSKRIDISFQPLASIKHVIKQRQTIKLHIGTQEVMGRIIFFDRNEIKPNEADEVLCQIQVEEAIVVARGDHFIVRRPTPAETIGGGWVIDANADKLKFSNDTIERLNTKKAGSPEDRLKAIMNEKPILTKADILNLAAISNEELKEIKPILLAVEIDQYTLTSTLKQTQNNILRLIEDFHSQFPMRQGINKAEIISALKEKYPLKLLEFALEKLKDDKINIDAQYISLSHVSPSLPSAWQKRLENIEKTLIEQGLEANKWDELLEPAKIPPLIGKEFYYYLLQTGRAYVFDNERLISRDAVDKAIKTLKQQTNNEDFTLQTAREVLGLSRKNLVPILELLDYLGYTKRTENLRKWVNH